MKILFFTRLFYPHIGGVEKHVFEISKHLLQMGHTVTVVTEELSQKDMEKAALPPEIKGIQLYRIPAGREGKMKKFRIWEWLYQHPHIIKDADIVHCHDVFFWYFPFRLRYPFKKIYTTFHGYETKFPVSKKAIQMRKLAEKLSRGNICVGKFIEKWYGTKANIISYGGTDAYLSKVETSTFKHKLRIVFVGRLEKDTGIPIYIQLIQCLKKKNIDFSFDIYGDGSLRKELEQIGTVHGFITNPQEIMTNADILFVSSYLSILDGLALKKLIVSVYDNPLKKDYLQKTPYSEYILIGDTPLDLSEDLIDLLTNDKKRNYMLEKGSEYAKTQTWEKVTTQYLTLWKK